MNTEEKTKMWETLKLYKHGKSVPVPDDFDSEKDFGRYMFELTARFQSIEDAEMFAKIKSKNAEIWKSYSVTKNLSGDPLGEYYVYEVLTADL